MSEGWQRDQLWKAAGWQQALVVAGHQWGEQVAFSEIKEKILAAGFAHYVEIPIKDDYIIIDAIIATGHDLGDWTTCSSSYEEITLLMYKTEEAALIAKMFT